jgi:aminopeptidase N
MEWWSFLWLNEGFARFMEHLAVDHIYPAWKIWESFVAEVFAQAQSLDSLESSHPVEVTVHHASEVNEIFDSISYAKGASLIRMLNAAIGDEAFRTGLQAYLRKFSFQNTVSRDLWDALSESSGTDVGALMGAWVEKVSKVNYHNINGYSRAMARSSDAQSCLVLCSGRLPAPVRVSRS